MERYQTEADVLLVVAVVNHEQRYSMVFMEMWQKEFVACQ